MIIVLLRAARKAANPVAVELLHRLPVVVLVVVRLAVPLMQFLPLRRLCALRVLCIGNLL